MSDNTIASTPITLVESKAITESLYELTYTRPEGWDFEPGQFARLGVQIDGEPEAHFRAYSIASTPSEKVLRFLVKVILGGKVSPVLTQMKVGETVLLEGEAQGNLLPARIPGGKSLWYIATGAGLAPFLSIIKANHETHQESREEILVVGARSLEEVEKLKVLAREASPTCRVYGATTREPSELQGRLPLLLTEGTLEAFVGSTFDPEDSRVMLCGNPDCMKEARKIFKSRGLVAPRFGAPGQLLVETLW